MTGLFILALAAGTQAFLLVSAIMLYQQDRISLLFPFLTGLALILWVVAVFAVAGLFKKTTPSVPKRTKCEFCGSFNTTQLPDKHIKCLECGCADTEGTQWAKLPNPKKRNLISAIMSWYFKPFKKKGAGIAKLKEGGQTEDKPNV